MRKQAIQRFGGALLCCFLCTCLAGSAQAMRSGNHTAVTNAAAVHQDASRAAFEADLNDVKLLSYYPVSHSWANMWTQWDPGAINSDFGHAAFLHANAIRIIVNAPVFGYPTPQQVMLDRLATVVRLARQHDLRVQLTLFDAWTSYHDLAGSEQWARAVLAPYRGDRSIAFVEPRNEIYPFDPATMVWARQMAAFIHQFLPGVPVTYSAAGKYGVHGLAVLAAALGSAVDFYSFHYYGTAQASYTTFSQARAAVAPMPLYIGETGFSSIPYNVHIDGLPPNDTAMEYYQDYYYRTVQEAAERLGLPPVAVWDLNDFAPSTIPGRSPNSYDYHYGLYRYGGTLKPVAWSVRTFFLSRSIHLAYNADFEQGYNQNGTMMPLYWRVSHGITQFAQDTSVAHSGHASARISHSDSGAGDGWNAPAFYIAPIDPFVGPGQFSSAGAWVRGQNATGTTTVILSWFDVNDHLLASSTSAPLATGTTGWTWLSASGSAPANAAYLQIYLRSASNKGTVWFDDVRFS